MDQAHQHVTALGSEVQHTKQRVSGLEEVARHQNAAQASAASKIERLERELVEHEPRCKGTVSCAVGGRSPRDLDAELQIVVEFIEKLGEKATKRHEMPEIDWRGSLYVGNVQLVGSTDRTDPAPDKPVCGGK